MNLTGSVYTSLFLKDIPVWLRWAQYLCSLKYSINIMATIEMQDPPANLAGNITNSMYVSDGSLRSSV